MAVWAPPTELDRVAAVVLSPVAALVSWWRRAGTGLGEGTIRYRARDLLDLPLPADAARWDAAAALVPRLDESGADPLEVLDRLAREMLVAYRLPPGAADEVHAWWWARLPTGR